MQFLRKGTKNKMRSRKEFEEDKDGLYPELKNFDVKFDMVEELLLDIRDLLQELVEQNKK